jgi:glutathione synthase/RimK-type ligase-like ATP-grasp enzyme
MKHALVIGGRTTDSIDGQDSPSHMAAYATYFAADIVDLDVRFAHFDELSLVVSPDSFLIYDHKNLRSLSDYDLIIFRGKVRANGELAYCVSRFAALNGIKFFNDYTPYRPASKVSQAVTFHELGIRFTKTIYAMDPDIFDATVKRELKTPFILKDSLGSHGESNYLLRSYDELGQIITRDQNIKYLAQDYFANDCDYRLLCVGKDQLILRRRASGDTHLNNTSQGGTAEIVETDFLPSSAVREAHLLCDHVGMSIAGVDLLYDEASGDYAFLEINSQPQLMTGAFPKEKQALVARFLQSLL